MQVYGKLINKKRNLFDKKVRPIWKNICSAIDLIKDFLDFCKTEVRIIACWLIIEPNQGEIHELSQRSCNWRHHRP
jgi:hypothetical protein